MSAIFLELLVMSRHRLDDVVDHARCRASRHPPPDSASLRRLRGVVGVLLHGGGHLLHARRRFLQRGRLLFGALRQIGVARRDLRCADVDVFRAVRTRETVSTSPACMVASAKHQAGRVAVAPARGGEVAARNPLRRADRHFDFAAERTESCAPRSHDQRGDAAATAVMASQRSQTGVERVIDVVHVHASHDVPVPRCEVRHVIGLDCAKVAVGLRPT